VGELITKRTEKPALRLLFRVRDSAVKLRERRNVLRKSALAEVDWGCETMVGDAQTFIITDFLPLQALSYFSKTNCHFLIMLQVLSNTKSRHFCYRLIFPCLLAMSRIVIRPGQGNCCRKLLLLQSFLACQSVNKLKPSMNVIKNTIYLSRLYRI
jgi:hypothetical protein